MKASRWLIVVAILVTAREKVSAQCVAYENGVGLTNAGSIALVPGSNFPAGDALDQAASRFSACSNYGADFPYVVAYSGADIQIPVSYHTGNSTSQTGGCANSEWFRDAGGALYGASINVWQNDSNSNPCDLPDSVAHELGHILGLNDVFGSECLGSLMGPGSLTPGSVRYPSGDQCTAIGNLWATPQEGGSDPWCDAYCWTSCQYNSCPPYPWPDPPGCPVMLDVDGDGFALTGAQEGVAFDLIPDRLADRTAWTERGRLDAFLALDRNANGIIESGVELFGNYTRLSDGSVAPHGFVALAEYDTPQLGGNGDSRISAADAVFDWLRLWIDLNHDGQTQSGELRTLRSAGIVALETNYVETRHQDKHGNEFRFKGKAWKQGRRGAVIPTEMYDVFLAQDP